MTFRTIIFLLIICSCTVDKKSTGSTTLQESIKNEDNKQVNSAEQEESETATDLIGIWQNSPEIASGYTDYYEFFENGDFIFNYNEMICDKRTINYSGTWKLEGNDSLKLTIQQVTTVIGGKRVPTLGAGSCASDYYIDGGERKVIDLKDFVHQNIILSFISVDKEKRDLKTRTFDKDRFWKIKDESASY